jgi:hypothetical protein
MEINEEKSASFAQENRGTWSLGRLLRSMLTDLRSGAPRFSTCVPSPTDDKSPSGLVPSFARQQPSLHCPPALRRAARHKARLAHLAPWREER